MLHESFREDESVYNMADRSHWLWTNVDRIRMALPPPNLWRGDDSADLEPKTWFEARTESASLLCSAPLTDELVRCSWSGHDAKSSQVNPSRSRVGSTLRLSLLTHLMHPSVGLPK